MKHVYLSQKLLIWFAKNHEEELYLTDIHEQWGVTPDSARQTCAQMAKTGFLSRRLEPNPHHQPFVVYSAGPVILKEIGEHQ